MTNEIPGVYVFSKDQINLSNLGIHVDTPNEHFSQNIFKLDQKFFTLRVFLYMQRKT